MDWELPRVSIKHRTRRVGKGYSHPVRKHRETMSVCEGYRAEQGRERGKCTVHESQLEAKRVCM